MFFDGITVGHACNIIADRAFESALFDEELDVVWQDGWFGAIGLEQIRDDALSLDLHPHHAIMTIKFSVKQVFQFTVAALHFFAVTDDVMFELLNIQRAFHFAVLDAYFGCLQHICHHQANQLADHAVAFHFVENCAAPVVRLAQDFP